MVVERFQENLISVMKEAHTLNVEGRYRRLEPSVTESFYLPVMIRIAVGNYWKTANKEQQKQLANAFKRMSISTLATLFDGYSSQSFKTVGEKKGPQRTLLVETKLITPNESAVDIAYVTRKYKDKWRIIDVILDNGISELSVRRSEYRLLLKQKGVGGLITALNSKADQLISK